MAVFQNTYAPKRPNRKRMPIRIASPFCPLPRFAQTCLQFGTPMKRPNPLSLTFLENRPPKAPKVPTPKLLEGSQKHKNPEGQRHTN